MNVPNFYLPFPFSAFNYSNGEPISNGSSWGIELLADNQVIYRDIRGNAVTRPALPISFGARRGSFSQGLVFEDTIYISKDGSVPITSGSYQLRIYNVSDNANVVINNNQTFSLTAQSPFETFYTVDGALHSGSNTITFQTKTANNTPLETYPRAIADFILSDPAFPLSNLTAINNNLQNQRSTYTWGFDLFRNGQLIYRNRDGERENLEVGSGTFQSFPSGAEFNKLDSSGAGTVVKNETLTMTLP